VWWAVSILGQLYGGVEMVEEGKPAPDIELTTDSGERVKLSDFPRAAGRPLLLSEGRHAASFRQYVRMTTRRVVGR